MVRRAPAERVTRAAGWAGSAALLVVSGCLVPQPPPAAAPGAPTVAAVAPCPPGTTGTAPHCQPLPDADGDGVPDRFDYCADVPGVPSGERGEHGCPPKDTDADGVADSRDWCPDRKAHAGFDLDGDGCDDLADRDGIPDAVDACPHETGPDTTDPATRGCPAHVRVTRSAILLLSPIEFEIAKDRIQPTSLPIVDEIASVLEEHPEITRVEIQAHYRDDGSMSNSLSARRAKSMMRALVKKGVAPARIIAHGYGDTKPLDRGDTPEGRKRNRRIEILILPPINP